MMTSLMRMTMTTTTSPRAAHRARRELEENVARHAGSFSLDHSGWSLRSLSVVESMMRMTPMLTNEILNVEVASPLQACAPSRVRARARRRATPPRCHGTSY